MASGSDPLDRLHACGRDLRAERELCHIEADRAFRTESGKAFSTVMGGRIDGAASVILMEQELTGALQLHLDEARMGKLEAAHQERSDSCRPLPGGGPRLITPDFPGGWPAPPGTCEQVPGGWSAPPGTLAQVPGGWSAPPGTCDHPDFLGTFEFHARPESGVFITTIKFGDAIAVLVARASRRVGVSLLRLTRGHCMNRIAAQCKFGKFRKVLIRRCMTVMTVF